MQLANRANILGASVWLGLLMLLLSAASSPAIGLQTNADTSGTFRWVHPGSDPQVWQEIQSAFHDELAPDEAKKGQDALDVYRYKYLQKVGVLNHSALVIIGHRPAKELSKVNAWDEYHSAFDFDLATRKKSSIEHADRMWQWKFRALATFGPSRTPDVTFNYLTCTECEPDLMFASLHYDATKSAWQVRSWGDGKDIWWTATDGLVVDMDLNTGGDTISFDCNYGILNSKVTGFQDLAIRCKEVTYRDTGRAKVDDTILLYSSSEGQFRPRQITEIGEVGGLNAKMCGLDSQILLCKLPAALTVTSGQNPALDEMFPNAPKTSRDLADFRALKRTMSMMDVVRRCDEPDEVGGSGIDIFIYHLYDGSLVAIGAANATSPILYASHIETTGKASSLLPAE